MFDAKLLADLITVVRAMAGMWIAWLGLTRNEEALPVVALVMILCWTGDFVDGTLAHRSRHPRHTWVGDRDVNVDAFVSLCLAVYMIGAGHFNLLVGGAYLFGWTIVFLFAGNDRNLLMLAQTPIYLTFTLIVLQISPERGYLMVAWVATALAINWRRFSADMVPKFIDHMRSLWDGHSKPHHS